VRPLRIFTFLAAVAALATIAASPPRPPESNLPSGSYQQSCRGASMRGSTLSAQCPQASGAPVFSSIDVNACRGRDIANDNGRLVCGGGGGITPPEPSLPSGSYQQSCRGASMRGSILSAQCPGRSGAPQFSSIDVNACRGRDIANDNGRLACSGGGGVRPPEPSLPNGSYQQSCRGASMRGSILSAQCPGRSGAPQFSSIDVRSCQGRDIANDNGRLACGRGGGGVGPGPGHSRHGLRAYTGTRFSGSRLDVNAERYNLSLVGFNDRIRSIRVDGGQWEICSDAYFRGRCVTITQSVANLNDIGMSGVISSIRPR